MGKIKKYFKELRSSTTVNIGLKNSKAIFKEEKINKNKTYVEVTLLDSTFTEEKFGSILIGNATDISMGVVVKAVLTSFGDKLPMVVEELKCPANVRNYALILLKIEYGEMIIRTAKLNEKAKCFISQTNGFNFESTIKIKPFAKRDMNDEYIGFYIYRHEDGSSLMSTLAGMNLKFKRETDIEMTKKMLFTYYLFTGILLDVGDTFDGRYIVSIV